MTIIKPLVQISFVTETLLPIYKPGDVDGYFNQDTLEEYIDMYGSNDLIQHLASLTANVVEVQRRINSERAMEGIISENVSV